ncbi:MAG: general stress protein [Fimbriimonadaceae bacterium]
MNTTNTFTDHTVAVYATHNQAEAAIKSLRDSGFDLKNLSIIGQDYATEEHPIGFINTGDRMLSWGKFGAFWGSIWGLLFGSAMLFVPGIGYLMFAGWLVGALEGAALGGAIAALGGALASIGVPKDSVVRYESELKAGSFLVVAHGTEADMKRAKDALAATSPTRVDSYATQQTAGAL